MSTLIERAAQSLQAEPTVMASALAECRRRATKSDAALAAWLGLSVDRLAYLALCRRPDSASASFEQDVTALAAFIGCHADRLRQLLTIVAQPAP